MRAEVIEGCISCGLCESTCPEVFQIADDGFAHAYGEVTKELEASAQDAADGCPVSVIIVE